MIPLIIAAIPLIISLIGIFSKWKLMKDEKAKRYIAALTDYRSKMETQTKRLSQDEDQSKLNNEAWDKEENGDNANESGSKPNN